MSDQGKRGYIGAIFCWFHESTCFRFYLVHYDKPNWIMNIISVLELLGFLGCVN